jgi:RNA polymerase sigma-70 factor, ECF subfamily
MSGVLIGGLLMDEPAPDSKTTQRLLDRAGDGDPAIVSELLARHRPAMRELVRMHLDSRLTARIDPSDVVQDAQLDIARRLRDFLDRRPMPFHVWARKTAYERLLDARRHHLGRAKRSVRRERPLPDRSSLLVARPLLSRGPSPSQTAAANEFGARVSRAVAGLPDEDREVLLMRHADGLPFPEAAVLLGITPAAARKRFGRALIRLQAALAAEGLLGGT